MTRATAADTTVSARAAAPPEPGTTGRHYLGAVWLVAVLAAVLWLSA